MEERRLALKPHDNSSGSFRLDHKGVVVTGGANGIGRAVAKTFASHGACVRILDIDREQAEATAKEITRAGGQAAAYLCDVSDHASVETVFHEVFEQERVHILVNSAGICHQRPGAHGRFSASWPRLASLEGHKVRARFD